MSNNNQTNNIPITVAVTETVANNIRNVVLSNQIPLAVTEPPVNVSSNHETTILTDLRKNISTFVSTDISNKNGSMIDNFTLTITGSSTTAVTTTVADTSNATVESTELTETVIDKASANMSMAVHNISISNEVSNTTNSEGFSREKRNIVTTNTITGTTITEINPSNSKHKGNPIQLTPIMECYVKRIINDFTNKEAVECDLLKIYAEQSLQYTANFGVKILSSLKIIMFVLIVAFIL